MGLSAHDQTFALRVDLKEITELSGVKKQAGAELYPKLSKKFKKVRKKCEKHQIFRKLAADSSADASADEVGRINIGEIYSEIMQILFLARSTIALLSHFSVSPSVCNFL